MRRLLALVAAAAFVGGCANLPGAPQTRTMGAAPAAGVVDHQPDWVSTAAGYRPDPFRVLYGPGA